MQFLNVPFCIRCSSGNNISRQRKVWKRCHDTGAVWLCDMEESTHMQRAGMQVKKRGRVCVVVVLLPSAIDTATSEPVHAVLVVTDVPLIPKHTHDTPALNNHSMVPVVANDVALHCCAISRQYSLEQHPAATPPVLVFRLLRLLLISSSSHARHHQRLIA